MSSKRSGGTRGLLAAIGGWLAPSTALEKDSNTHKNYAKRMLINEVTSTTLILTSLTALY